MVLKIEQFPCRSDNFGVLIHDTEANVTASIDAPEFQPIVDRLADLGWDLDEILVTHHHEDHVEANLTLKTAYDCKIVGPAGKIPGVDRTVKDGDTFTFGTFEVQVIATPGHTLDHISYYLPAAKVAFVADTLFALGCGRVFEGTPEMMWESLAKLAALPDDTTIYCGHEYTQANAKFALTIEPENTELVARAAEIDQLRAEGKPTLPTTIAREKATNPFLRVGSPAIRKTLGLEGASQAEVFAEVRKRKDNF
ncbi:hydroxyacylglutathione hydrolase [Bauldia litoralis]|uniref:Hydroxyacylglutathione hydrolase n=1 Tax=Bauldia litoralis TaxID=665467 RepID=A0A1G6BZC0_9HYPH|nr:hydroxyacylglutathione hydrolase [Bauldia litoralis]SDB25952.1 hydroxyacylglutathione hydrolase [Bauldia litoralis]